MNDATLFAFALEQLDGVGRVSAGRILAHFSDHADLLRYPREQVLLRIKGVPRAEALAGKLLDEAFMQDHLAQARAMLAQYTRRSIQVLSAADPHWPKAQLASLAPARRPNVLYIYGTPALFDKPLVALLARPPVADAAFELAQDLVRYLMPLGVVPVAGAVHGFDVVVHRICATSPEPAPSMMVASTGLAKVATHLRSHISAGVKAGGLFVSSFPVTHGPFDHDDRERALLATALATAVVCVEPKPDTPEWAAMEWAIEHQKPVFGMPHPEHPVPPQVHPLHSAADFDWIQAATSLG